MGEEKVKWMGTEISKYSTLDFDTFKSRNNSLEIPLFNNFFLYFIDDTVPNAYLNSPICKRLKQENPELVATLKEKLLKLDYKRCTPEWLDEVAPLLYKAYEIMKNYKIDGKPVANYPDLFA